MGPHDPFPPRTDRPGSGLGAPPPAPPSGGASPAPRSPRTGALAGLTLGAAFGFVVVVAGVGAALLVLFCAAVGAALGAVVYGALAGRLDPAAAWRSLWRSP